MATASNDAPVEAQAQPFGDLFESAPTQANSGNQIPPAHAEKKGDGTNADNKKINEYNLA